MKKFAKWVIKFRIPIVLAGLLLLYFSVII